MRPCRIWGNKQFLEVGEQHSGLKSHVLSNPDSIKSSITLEIVCDGQQRKSWGGSRGGGRALHPHPSSMSLTPSRRTGHSASEHGGWAGSRLTHASSQEATLLRGHEVWGLRQPLAGLQVPVTLCCCRLSSYRH